MSKPVRLYNYEALTDFTSIKLQKTVKKGDIIKAPSSLGSQWIKSKIAIKSKTSKQELS